MDVSFGQQLTSTLRLNICTCLCMVAILAVTGARTLDNTYDKDIISRREFQTIWNTYILPGLEKDLFNYHDTLHNRDSADLPVFTESDSLAGDDDETRLKRDQTSHNMWKRIAGLGNLDMMTKTLDSARTLPFRTGFKFNRLQALMRAQGRRRK